MSFLGTPPAAAAINASHIPDNSINASKIIDGSIDVADVSSDIVTLTGSQTLTNKTLGSGVVYPAGHVLQIVFGSAVVSSGSSAVNTNMGVNVSNPLPNHNEGMTAGTQAFTPKYANSKILVQTNNIFMCETANVSDHAHLWLQDNTANAVLSHFAMYATINSSGDGLHGGIMCLNHVFDSWGTDARTLEFRIGHDGGQSNNFRWNPYYNSGARNSTETGQFHWTLTEIAQ